MKRILSAIFLTFFFLIAVSSANAGLQDAFGNTLQKTGDSAGYKSDATVSLESTISNLITVFLSILGIIFVGLLIYAGINWMTAGGQEKRVEESKAMIKQSIIGLIIVLGAYAISYFIINALTGVAGQGEIEQNL